MQKQQVCSRDVIGPSFLPRNLIQTSIELLVVDELPFICDGDLREICRREWKLLFISPPAAAARDDPTFHIQHFFVNV